MSPGAQPMAQICCVLIQKVMQSTEPEACAVYESGEDLGWSGRGTQATRFPVLLRHSKFRTKMLRKGGVRDSHWNERDSHSNELVFSRLAFLHI